MEIFFYGSAVSKEFQTKNNSSVAANKFQTGLLQALYNIASCKLFVVSRLPVGTVFSGEKLLIKQQQEEIFNGFFAKTQPMINLPVIKLFCAGIDIFLKIHRFINKNKNQKTVLLYNTTAIPVLFCALSKKINKKIRFVYIFTEPIYSAKEHRGFSKILSKIDSVITKKSLKAFDMCVALSPFSAQEFMQKKPYIVVEGGFSKTIYSTKNSQKQNEIKKILFSGALTKYNGIQLLIDATQKVNRSDFVLEIYGQGELEAFVLEKAKTNDKIKFFGQISNRQILEQQQRADFLISLRDDSLHIVKHSFPSKIIEYLQSGTPIISTDLCVYSKRLKAQMILSKEKTPESCAKAIEEALSLSKKQRKKIGENAKTFAQKNYTWERQAKRIMEFICQ